jgi:hypothetical protein
MEPYVRPVTAAREPAPEWHAVWRFRAVALILLAVLAVVTVWGVNKLLHAADQDPTPLPSPSQLSPGPELPVS